MPWKFDGIYRGSPRADSFDLVVVMRSPTQVEPYPMAKLNKILFTTHALPGDGWGEPYLNASVKHKSQILRDKPDSPPTEDPTPWKNAAPVLPEKHDALKDHILRPENITDVQWEFIKARKALRQAMLDVRSCRRSILDFPFWGQQTINPLTQETDPIYVDSYHDQTAHLLESVLEAMRSEKKGLTKAQIAARNDRIRRYGITRSYFLSVARESATLLKSRPYYLAIKGSLALTFAAEPDPAIAPDFVERTVFSLTNLAFRVASHLGATEPPGIPDPLWKPRRPRAKAPRPHRNFKRFLAAVPACLLRVFKP